MPDLWETVIGGGLFLFLGTLIGLYVNRNKLKSETDVNDAQSEKLRTETIITLLQQGKKDYEERELRQKEWTEKENELYTKIRALEEGKRESESRAIQYLEERDKLRADNIELVVKMGVLEGLVEKQGTTLIEMNKKLLEIKKDTGNLVSK